MKIILQNTNHTLIQLKNGDEIFVSYKTPVAGFFSGFGYVKTKEFWSNTTSRHIKEYLGELGTTKMVNQSFLDKKLAEI